MDKPLYSIRNWGEHYEIAQSRRNRKQHSWVAIPNKHDGKSFRRLMALRDSMEIYGAWCLIVQVASKCPTRGVLADEDGPLGAEELALKTGGTVRVFSRALEVLSTEGIRWIVCTQSEGSPSADGAQSESALSAVGEQSDRALHVVPPTIPNHTIPDHTEPNLLKSAGADASFDRFWNAFPKRRRTGKGKAREAWKKALKKSDAETLISAAAEYAASDVGQGEFAKMPSSWLNGECWTDEREAWGTPVVSRVATEEDVANWNPMGDS